MAPRVRQLHTRETHIYIHPSIYKSSAAAAYALLHLAAAAAVAVSSPFRPDGVRMRKWGIGAQRLTSLGQTDAVPQPRRISACTAQKGRTHQTRLTHTGGASDVTLFAMRPALVHGAGEAPPRTQQPRVTSRINDVEGWCSLTHIYTESSESNSIAVQETPLYTTPAHSSGPFRAAPLQFRGCTLPSDPEGVLERRLEKLLLSVLGVTDGWRLVKGDRGWLSKFSTFIFSLKE